MSAEKFLYSHLLGDANIAALVGTRVYPEGSQGEQTPPYITYERTTEQDVTSHSGYSGLTACRFDVTCYSKSSAERNSLGLLVKKRLRDFTGTVNGVEVQRCVVAATGDGFENKLFARWIDVTVWHGEAA